MSQRHSGYVRKERDLYETPEWVTEALIPHLRGIRMVRREMVRCQMFCAGRRLR